MCNSTTKMTRCHHGVRRITPTASSGNGNDEPAPHKPTRVNGWTCPPQVNQVSGWLVLSYLAVVSLGVFIPLLPPPWNYALYALTGVLFVVHMATHIAAVTIDPACDSVRAKEYYYSQTKPIFDRKKQAHVILNQRCFLCDVKVGPKVKHCGICNKCVDNFDHHCNWLNNCVGDRNYWYFFVTCLSATAGVLVILIVVFFIFIQHYLDPNRLRTAPQFDNVRGNDTWLMFLPLAPMKTSSTSLLALAFLTILICFLSLLMLLHLVVFHINLLCKGIGTFDHLKMQRERKEARNRDKETRGGAQANDTQVSRRCADCQWTHSSRSCTCRRQWTVSPSEFICNQKFVKKPSETDGGSHNEMEIPQEIVICGGSPKDTENFTLEPDVDAQSVDRTSRKSAVGTPGSQNPLGSSSMMSSTQDGPPQQQHPA